MSATIVLLTAEDERHWSQHGRSWREAAPVTTGQRIHVVTDMAEESLQTFDMPRLFGADYTAFRDRRIAELNPDTLVRACLPFGRNPFVARRHLAISVGAQERLATRAREWEESGIVMVGIWPLAAGLWALTQKLPPAPLDILVARFGDAYRLLFLSAGIPLLVRRIVGEAESLGDEIARTRRYLFNQKLIPLDAGKGILHPLALSERDLAALAAANESIGPAFHPNARDDETVLAACIAAGMWRLPQLAPDDWRLGEFAHRGRIGAAWAATISVLTAIALAWPAAEEWNVARRKSLALTSESMALTTQSQTLREKIAASGINVDILKMLDHLEKTLLHNPPVPSPLLTETARRIGNARPSMSAHRLRWQVTETPCRDGSETASPGTPQNPAASQEPAPSGAAAASPGVELRLIFTPAPEDAPQMIRRRVESVGRVLADVPGMRLLSAPDKKLHERRLVGRAGKNAVGDGREDLQLLYCLGDRS